MGTQFERFILVGDDRLTPVLKNVTKALKGVDDAADGASDATDDLTKSQKSNVTSSKDSTKASAALGIGFAAVATAAIAGAAAVFALAQSTADLRNDLNDMAARTGIAAKTLAGLKLAAEGSGLQFSDLQSVLAPLGQRLGQIRTGSADVEKQFTSLGVALRNANGDLITNDEALANIVKRLQAIEDPGEKAQVAMTLLGKSGGKLLQALGGGELEAFVDQAERFGVDIGPEASESAGNFQRSMADLSLILGGVTSDLSDFFAVSETLDDFVIGMVLLTETARAFAQVVDEAVLNSLGALKAALNGNIEAVEFFAEKSLDTEDALGEVFRRADEATQAFVDNRAAMRQAGESADEYSSQLDGISQASGEAEQAQKALEAQFRKEDAAFEKLSDIAAKASEDLLSNREQAQAAANREIETVEQLASVFEDTELGKQLAAQATFLIQEDLDRELRQLSIDAGAAEILKGQESIDRAKEIAEELRRINFETEKNFQTTARETEQVRTDIQQQLLDSSLDAAAQTLDNVFANRDATLAAAEDELTSRKRLTDKQQELLEGIQRKRKTAAIAQFAAQKAFALSSAAIDAARAAIAFNLPPPAGIGFPQGTFAAGALFAGQAAVIASQSPPSFAHGGRVEGAPGLPVAATLEAGEAVLNQSAVRAIGEQGVDALNDGATVGGGTVTQIFIGGRQLEPEMVRTLQGADAQAVIADSTNNPADGAGVFN